MRSVSTAPNPPLSAGSLSGTKDRIGDKDSTSEPDRGPLGSTSGDTPSVEHVGGRMENDALR
jgi:hypothetical protein